MKTETRPACDCGNSDASWHGDRCGLRQYMCAKCWSDLQRAIESERHGEGPLNMQELLEMNEFEIVLGMRGRLGMLGTARLEWLKERFSKHGRKS